jgi:D-sedoheptulose 7-phosphate isomerase
MSELILSELLNRYPVLEPCAVDIMAAYELLVACYEKDGIVYLCGNGGSAADAEHIVGELMKGFCDQRPLPDAAREAISDNSLADSLQGALRAVALTGHSSLSTAIANDIDPELVYAQQIYGYGREGDTLWGLSTSGNALNVVKALKVARARGIKTLGLTGQEGGSMKELCDVCICAPEQETFKIQELHLPVYHALCRMLEGRFFKA